MPSDFQYSLSIVLSGDEAVSVAEDEIEQILLDGLDRLGRYADQLEGVFVYFEGEVER